MKPTTEQILSALNEMIQSKTELKAEKVELGLKDDIDSDVKSLVPKFKDLGKLLNERNETFAKYEKLDKKLLAEENYLLDKAIDIGEAVDRLKKAEKELGVDANSSYYEKQINNLKTAIKSKMYG